MKIEAKKVVDQNGEKMIKFTGFSGMTRAENLPKKYIKKRCIYPNYSGNGVICVNKPVFCPVEVFTGQLYSQEEWNAFLEQVEKSARRLRIINSEIAKIRKSWNGKVDYEF